MHDDKRRVEKLLSILPPDEQVLAATYRVESARTAFIIRRAMLRHHLSSALDVPFNAIRFGVGTHGKPYVLDAQIHFSLSQSGDWVLIEIVRDFPIGADIEVIRDLSDDLNWIMTTAQSMFAPEECAALEACSTHEKRRELFFKYWTLKEAIVKATGYGLTVDTRNFAVEFDVKTARIAWSNLDAIPISGWLIHHYTVLDDQPMSTPFQSFALAVAYRRKDFTPIP